eukprot:Amastigsp_a15148_3.p2 type:complete len:154 gc:universal Amastigsp_a15148_3:651-1112(+)
MCQHVRKLVGLVVKREQMRTRRHKKGKKAQSLGHLQHLEWAAACVRKNLALGAHRAERRERGDEKLCPYARDIEMQPSPRAPSQIGAAAGESCVTSHGGALRAEHEQHLLRPWVVWLDGHGYVRSDGATRIYRKVQRRRRCRLALCVRHGCRR